MSLGVVIKGPEGVVLACDSRVTLSAQKKDGTPPISVNFDNATKLLSYDKPHNYFGAVTYGTAVIGLRTAHSFIPELQNELGNKRKKKVLEYAEIISKFFTTQWEKVYPSGYDGPPMIFVVGGYDENSAYPKMYKIDIPFAQEPIEQNPGDTSFGISWGGQLEIASRLIHGFDPGIKNVLESMDEIDKNLTERIIKKFRESFEISIPYQILPLQDCIDLAHFMIQTTIIGQSLSIGLRGVGGPIDVAVITKTGGVRYIQQKNLKL